MQHFAKSWSNVRSFNVFVAACSYFVITWCILCEICSFLTLKTFFTKSKIQQFQYFLSGAACWEFLGVVYHNKMHTYIQSKKFVFSHWCYGTCKNTIFFVTTATITQGEKSLFVYTETKHQVNQLTKFQVKLITLS